MKNYIKLEEVKYFLNTAINRNEFANAIFIGKKMLKKRLIDNK
jgi:hypothetical protein